MEVFSSDSSQVKPENLVWSRFVCCASLDLKNIDEIVLLTSDFSNDIRFPFDSFVSGMRSINHIVCMPFAFTVKGKYEVIGKIKIFELVRHYEKIVPQTDFQKRDDWVSEIKARVRSDINSDENFGSDIDDVLHEISEEMLNFESRETVDTMARDLRYQTAVSLWSCLETFIKDHLISIINEDSSLFIKIYENNNLRKKIGLDGINFIHLIDADFNLKNILGNLIFEEFYGGKVGNLLLLLRVMYPHLDLADRLSAGRISKLILKRNLIVHRRGICDKEYKFRSGDKVEIGQNIDVTPGSIINLYQEIGAFVVRVANDLREKSS